MEVDQPTQDALGTLLRHGLTAAGGALVTKGILAAGIVEPITGTLLALAGLALSHRKNRRAAKAEKAPAHARSR